MIATRSKSISSIDDVAISQSTAHIRSSSSIRTVERIERKTDKKATISFRTTELMRQRKQKKKDKRRTKQVQEIQTLTI